VTDHTQSDAFDGRMKDPFGRASAPALLGQKGHQPADNPGLIGRN
jgi:hypothetical protein